MSSDVCGQAFVTKKKKNHGSKVKYQKYIQWLFL